MEAPHLLLQCFHLEALLGQRLAQDPILVVQGSVAIRQGTGSRGILGREMGKDLGTSEKKQTSRYRRGERSSCMAMSEESAGDTRPTLGLVEDGEVGGEAEREATYTPPADFSLFREGDTLLEVRLVRAMLMGEEFL
ncbi:hypothetical protein LIER_16261 [Lithospermum erythrorhizon]|uniref:Uncharacterized protein n=1 Tax=Lithospermum erythrorhizon TaxID=34254 RepID=A0AAV3Q6E1_LITER